MSSFSVRALIAFACVILPIAAVASGCGETWRLREEVELEPIAVCQTPARTVPEWIPEAARVAFGHDEPVLRETPDEARDSFTTSVPAAPSSAIAIAAAPGCVDLNTAAVDVLVTLPGVGPSRAQQIVELRSRQPFAKLRHVRRIRGIGPATYRKMKERLCPLS